MSWHLNTSLWSLLVADAAVTLSQLTPISTWLPLLNLTVYVIDRMGVNDAIGMIGFNINVQLNNMGNTDIQAKRMEPVLRDSAGSVFAKPELIYFNPLITTSSPVAMPINPINVPKASDWSHAVLFIRPIGTSDEAEFLRVRKVVMSSILEQQEAIDKFFEIPSVYTKAEPNFFQQGQYEATLSVFIGDQEEPFTPSFSFTIFPNTLKYLDRKPKTTNSEQVSCQIGHPSQQNIRGFSWRRLRDNQLISPTHL